HLPAAACQVQQQVQAQVITPVEVLHHEQHGVPYGLLHHKMGHGREESSLLLFWIGRGGRGQGRQVRKQQRQLGQQARERRGEGVHGVWQRGRSPTSEIRPEEVQQR